MDRREFMGKSLGGIAGAALLGTAGGTLLEACSGPSGHPASRTQTSKYGGTLTMATWSEDNSLSPATAQFDSTGYLYANAIFDSLTQIGADGKAHPYLAKSVTPNADYTTWTVVMRPGVHFHDGTVCDGAAVKGSLEAVLSGLVTAIALKPVKDVRLVDSMTVAIDMHEPWIPFPAYLASQLGYIASPSMLKSSNQGAQHPIGTGPFIFQEWVVNDHLTVKRNPHYWQPQYPYLDKLIFKPVADPAARELALKSGAVQLIHSNYPGTLAAFQHDSSYTVTQGTPPPGSEPSADFLMLNCGKAPTNDQALRRALVQAIDKSVLASSYGFNLITPLTGPFPTGSQYYTQGQYPSYDLTAAKAGVSAYAAKHGGPPTIDVGTITGPEYASVVAVVSQQWKAAGVNVTTSQIETSSFITSAVLGNYQALTFQQFGATDPDQNYVWWSTETLGPPGSVSLNLARNNDPTIQKNLEIGRTNPDQAARTEAYKTVGERFSIDCPYIWLGETVWCAVGLPNVAGINGQILPDGSQSIGFNDGSFLVSQLRLNG
jgi:ABC-type transport system substrate-binding protein